MMTSQHIWCLEYGKSVGVNVPHLTPTLETCECTHVNSKLGKFILMLSYALFYICLNFGG